MAPKFDRLLFIALLLAILFHGSALVYNIDKTYDAFVHMFFADHYVRSWFDPWEPRWYTGFPVTSYPPLGHQLIALLSHVGGLKFGCIFLLLAALCFFVIGIYRFAQIWVPKRSAAYAAIFAVVASSIIQTIHIYGQLPTTVGISCLINALPEIYSYFRNGRLKHLLIALVLLGVTVASHHVTTIFGVVFFIAPVVATAMLDESGVDGNFFRVVKDVAMLALRKIKRFIIFFPILVLEMVIMIFPYWYYSRTDPINQVPIPHGSRDSFIAVPSSGLMFFIIPLGFTLLMLPFIFVSLYTRRNIFLALSFTILLVLGTGGTTPIPLMVLGKNAFNILTLDRFTFWASVIAIPFIGDFFCRLIEGDIRERIIARYSKKFYHITSLLIFSVIAFQALFVINFHKFRSLQPPAIDMRPILNFLDRDQHSAWRFMTLGFGDQMAWLSSQTTAYSIDGNYHSARRVPEMTYQPLERLENSKFKGIQGIGSLQQFLTIPEKYYLKFIFSNDKFYDPILYFAGWERVQRLENGIMVWQKHDVPPLPALTGRKYIADYQRMMWGILPVGMFILMCVTLALFRKNYLLSPFTEVKGDGYVPARHNRMLFSWTGILLAVFSGIWLKSALTEYNRDPITLLKAYYHALDFKYLREAHSYFPEGSIDLDNYILRLSVQDGLLASYGKLDSIDIKIAERSGTRIRADVLSVWVTPLERYSVTNTHILTRDGRKWLIQPPVFDSTIPPDEHIEKGIPVFHSQGKRVISADLTRHDDILDRPELTILSARLVRKKDQYVVVGELVNNDYLPAHITVQARLFDNANQQLVWYNAKYNTMHNILPAERVPFRIEFEETAWVKEEDKQPFKFDPGQFVGYQFTKSPAHFVLSARAVVADKDMYRDAGIQHISFNKKKKIIDGELFNYGTDEISVPEILSTYYDEDTAVCWVDHLFLRDGVRPQHGQQFQIDVPVYDSIEVIRIGKDEDFFINGLCQKARQRKINANRCPDIIALPGNIGFTRMIVNAYIGNPTVY